MTSLDTARLQSATPVLRSKTNAVMKDMEGAGYRPRVAEVLRSEAQQREKVRKGYSKTMNSKHRPGSDGLSRAVDICDADTGWAAKRTFWLTLGRCALLHGLGWGGLWGLGIVQRAKLKKFLTDRSKPWNPNDWDGPLGWDTAHLELS